MRMRNPQFYESGKRPMATYVTIPNVTRDLFLLTWIHFNTGMNK